LPKKKSQQFAGTFLDALSFIQSELITPGKYFRRGRYIFL